MADEITGNSVLFGSEALLIVERSAPIIFFEVIASFGQVAGVADVELITTRAVSGPGGKVIREANVVASLRCTRIGVTQMRDAMNSILLLMEPAAQPEPGKAN